MKCPNLIISAGFGLLVLGTAAGCPSTVVAPLIGEGPEVLALLEAEAPDDTRSSAMVSARRLHQALVQGDAATAWALLAEPTQRLLDERGASIGKSGRELLDNSLLPDASGTRRTVRFEILFFGSELRELSEGPRDGDAQTIFAIGGSGRVKELAFIREEAGWRLAFSEI